jgi:hypothetical protein
VQLSAKPVGSAVLGEGGRLQSGAEPAGPDSADSHLIDPRSCGRQGAGFGAGADGNCVTGRRGIGRRENTVELTGRMP